MVFAVTQGVVGVTSAALVGGGLLEVLPTVLLKVGGPHLGPGVALLGVSDTDTGLLCL